jgi:hypothetical protein
MEVQEHCAKYSNIFDRLNRARSGAMKIAGDMNLGPLLEEAQAAPNSRRLTFAYGTVIVMLTKARDHSVLGPLVIDPTVTPCLAESF